MKEEYTEELVRALWIPISTQPKKKRHLGAAVGFVAFRAKFVYGKVKSWCWDMELLSQVAVSQPHAVFVGYVHSWTSKWSYIYRTILGIGHLLEPLEQVV